MNSLPVDRERLNSALGGDNLAWLLDRLRKRMQRGRPLRGSLTLANPTLAQRDALNRLLGRSPSTGASVSVDLGQLDAILRHAGMCESLSQAVEAILGPVANHRELATIEAAQWNDLFQSRRLGLDARWRSWLDALQATGLLRRLSENDVEVASRLLDETIKVLNALPCRGTPLTELAAVVLGDSHALDAGRPVSTLVLRAISKPPVDGPSCSTRPGKKRAMAAWRRYAWASVGIMVDELSSPVLVLDLRAEPTSVTGRVLNIYADAGEPCRLSTRQLLREPPTFVADSRQTIFICENPTVVAAAASRLGSRSRPLICTEGQPKTAFTLLMKSLTNAGFALAYHGDFDWPGIQIANLLIERHGVTPWRFDAVSYGKVRGKRNLAGSPIVAAWDADLMPAMIRAGLAIYEEHVLDDLLSDLAATTEFTSTT